MAQSTETKSLTGALMRRQETHEFIIDPDGGFIRSALLMPAFERAVDEMRKVFAAMVEGEGLNRTCASKLVLRFDQCEIVDAPSPTRGPLFGTAMVVVNGETCEVGMREGQRLTYIDVVMAAGMAPSAVDRVEYSGAVGTGREDASGSLHRGESVRVKDGTAFTVSASSA